MATMRLSVITDEISQEFEHALDVMAEYGVRGAELRGLWGANIADLDARQIERAKRALAERGMIASALATPMFKCDLVEAAPTIEGPMHLASARGRADQMELLRVCANMAHQFDTDLIRVFTFWRKGELTPEIEEQIVAAFDEPLKIAEQEGVTLLLENEHACYIGTGAEAARILSAVNSPRLRACWDPGNAFCAGEVPYPFGYDEIRPWVAHVHIKDAVAEPGGQPHWTVVGQGDIDYTGQFEALRRDGYTGWVSLETHYRPESGSAEEGSRPCLEGLRRLVGA